MSDFNEFEKPASIPERNAESILSHAFEMYKGAFTYLLIGMVIYCAASFCISLLFSVDIDVEQMMESAREGYTDYGNLIYYGESYSYSTLISVLLSPLYAGALYVINKHHSSQPYEFSDLFIGYRQNLLQTLLYGLISAVILGISAMMCLIPFFFVFPFFLLGYPVLLFENATAVDAISKSYAIAKENYSRFLAVSFIALILGSLGIFLCGIGLLFSAPFIVAVMYSAYCAYVGKPALFNIK